MKKVLSTALVLVALVFHVNAATKTSITKNELPAAISADITQNYSAFGFKEAFKVNTNGVISYEIMLQKADEQLTLFYNQGGKFIKKVSRSASLKNGNVNSHSSKASSKR